MHFSFLEKVGGAIVLTAWLLYASSVAGNLLLHVEEPAVASAVAKPETEKAVKTEAAAPAVEDLAALLAAASPEAGAKAFKKCKACHTTAPGGANKVGPNLWDTVGRSKAAAPGFAYSAALKKLGGAWGYEDLDAFLTRPKEYAPGTKMGFAGLRKARDRAAVIAYLRSLSESPKSLP